MSLFERARKHLLLLVVDMQQHCFSVFDPASCLRNEKIEPLLQSAVSVHMRSAQCGAMYGNAMLSNSWDLTR